MIVPTERIRTNLIPQLLTQACFNTPSSRPGGAQKIVPARARRTPEANSRGGLQYSARPIRGSGRIASGMLI